MLGAAAAVGLRKAQNWFWTLSLIFNSLSGLVLLALQCPVDWGITHVHSPAWAALWWPERFKSINFKIRRNHA